MEGRNQKNKKKIKISRKQVNVGDNSGSDEESKKNLESKKKNKK